MGATSLLGVGGNGPRVTPAEDLLGERFIADEDKLWSSCWLPQKEVVQPWEYLLLWSQQDHFPLVKSPGW